MDITYKGVAPRALLAEGATRAPLNGGKKMKKPEHHIFVCGSFRANGAPQGVCNKKNSMGLLQYMEQELSAVGSPAWSC